MHQGRCIERSRVNQPLADVAVDDAGTEPFLRYCTRLGYRGASNCPFLKQNSPLEI